LNGVIGIRGDAVRDIMGEGGFMEEFDGKPRMEDTGPLVSGAAHVARTVSAGVASGEATATVGEAVLHNARAQVANDFLRLGEQSINNLGKQFAGASDSQLGGRVAEEAHAATFNADAVMKGRSNLFARTTAGAGRPHDVVDVEILSDGAPVSSAQLKYHGTAEKTAKALSNPEYRGQQKVGPADQLKGIRNTADKEAARNAVRRPEQAEHYRDTSARASDQLEYEGIKSAKRTRKGALKLARSGRKGQASLQRIKPLPTVKRLAEAAGMGALGGGTAGGLVNGAVAAYHNTREALRGEKSAGEAALDTAKASAVGAVEGAAKGAVGATLQAGVVALARSAAPQVVRQGARAAARSNVAIAAGAVIVDSIVGGAQYARGDINGREYAGKVGESASATGAGLASAKAGALLGTALVPGVGTIIGAVVGGIAGGMGGATVFRKLFRRR
jgi:hypothetical protein